MGFSRQEHWCGLPFPSPGDLPDPGIEPRSATLLADSLLTKPPGELSIHCVHFLWPGWLLISSCHNDDSVFLSYPHSKALYPLATPGSFHKMQSKGRGETCLIFWILSDSWDPTQMSEGTKADISWEENIPVSKVPVTYCPTRIKKKNKMLLILWLCFRLWCWWRPLSLPWTGGYWTSTS